LEAPFTGFDPKQHNSTPNKQNIPLLFKTLESIYGLKEAPQA